MSRYIEVEKAMELCDAFYFTEETCSVERLFKNAPSIDIVRCKECKNKDTYCDYCHKLEMNIKADDFCSYGERSSDEQ